MKTVAVTAPGQVEIIDTPQPTPGPYQALVRTELACVCNKTDGELVHGSFPGMEEAFPFALGHESVGRVEQIGDKVRNFTAGDRAVSGLVFDLGVEGNSPSETGVCEAKPCEVPKDAPRLSATLESTDVTQAMVSVCRSTLTRCLLTLAAVPE